MGVDVTAGVFLVRVSPGCLLQAGALSATPASTLIPLHHLGPPGTLQGGV